ncbi:hypothetical protein CGRA01v4_12032 [Colletotrichum graminicola]|nr:hypothetical protein CGRA01v4_12032 [Colletotrichum graminicola]
MLSSPGDLSRWLTRKRTGVEPGSWK